MTALYFATTCPAPGVYADFITISSAAALSAGNAPVSFNFLQGAMLASSKLRQNATRTDLLARYGSPAIHSICQGLGFGIPTAGLTLTVSAGHAICDGVIELPTDRTLVVPNNTDRVYVWMGPGTPTSVPVLDFTVTKTPPAGNQTFLGSVATTSGNILGGDTSGVFYNKGGLAYRVVGDTAVPTDVPASNITFLTRNSASPPQTYLWDGNQHGMASITSIPTPSTASFTNPMNSVGDMIIGGTSGVASRLGGGNGTAGQVLTYGTGGPVWATTASFANPMTTAGDVIYGGASGLPTRLPKGTAGQYLISTTGAPAWTSNVGAFEPFFGGAGVVIPVGQQWYIEAPFACTLTGWSIFPDPGVTGSIAFDIWKDTYANWPPTIADTIVASAKPAITAGVKNQSNTLTGWTTAVASGDVFIINVDSCATFTQCTLVLKYAR